jgi:hypothetical protein
VEDEPKVVLEKVLIDTRCKIVGENLIREVQKDNSVLEEDKSAIYQENRRHKAYGDTILTQKIEQKPEVLSEKVIADKNVRSLEKIRFE